MQEVFYEESVSLHNEKPAKFRYTLFTVFGILCFVSAASTGTFHVKGSSNVATSMITRSLAEIFFRVFIALSFCV